MSSHPVFSHADSSRSVAQSQRGAVLFISLILLVILSLIGIAGMQVTTLQERMSGNYYSIGRAFENSEWGVRETENSIQTQTNAGGTYVAATGQPAVDNTCANMDMDQWAASKTATSGYVNYVARIDNCIPGQTSVTWGKKKNEDVSSIYQVTSAEPDTTSASMANATSMVVVQTIYIP